MAEPFDSIISLIKTKAANVHEFEVDEESPAMPYVIVWGNAGAPDAPSLAGKYVASWGRVGVTVVDVTANNVLVLLQQVRSVLIPDAKALDFTADGRRYAMFHEDSQDVTVDDQVRIPASGKHPAFAVDVYSIHSINA